MDVNGTRDRLLATLATRRPAIERFYRYYRGEHHMPWAPEAITRDYGTLLALAQSNWCRLIVKVTSERLRVVGLRFSTEGGDTDAWARYWQGNRLDQESRLVHDAALIARRGFTLVWPTDGDGPPSITPEHPCQVIVDYEPGYRRKSIAGLKTFIDPVRKQRYATLWTPEAVYNWVARDPNVHLSGVPISSSAWQPWDVPDEGIFAEAVNPLGTIPLTEFVADPDMIDEPMGELDGGVLATQDRINRTVADRVITSNYASFRQKWVTGMEIPRDENGNEVEPFKVAVNRLFMSENPDTKFGEFGQSDLTGYIASIEADIQHLAATTRTPPHYLLGQSGAFPSGQSLKATETGLVAKVLERRDSFTESWEDTIRLALLADGDERSNDMALSMVWKDPESRSDAEKYDAATKMMAVGVPWREIMAYLGYSPTDIERMDAERAEDQATAMLSAMPPPPAPAPAPLVAV